jgi:hypothetical protein
LPPRPHSKNKHPKKFEGKEKGLSAVSNVADSPSALIVPPTLLQLVKLKGVIFAPVTLMVVEVISECVNAEPGLALISMVPVAVRVASSEETIVPSNAGLPVQEKLYVVAFPIVGQQHRTNATALPQQKDPDREDDNWGLAGHLVPPRGWGGGVDGAYKTYVIRFA